MSETADCSKFFRTPDTDQGGRRKNRVNGKSLISMATHGSGIEQMEEGGGVRKNGISTRKLGWAP